MVVIALLTKTLPVLSITVQKKLYCLPDSKIPLKGNGSHPDPNIVILPPENIGSLLFAPAAGGGVKVICGPGTWAGLPRINVLYMFA